MHKAIFMDRDGTVSEEVGYMYDAGQFQPFPWTGPAIRHINDSGMKAVLVTNQSGVERGYFKEAMVHQVHDVLSAELARHGARFDAIYFCPHQPGSGCDCRKPKPGMLLRAQKDLNIDLKQSYMIGDKYLDIETAHNAGARAVLVLTGYGHEELEKYKDAPHQPHFVADTLLTAVEAILNGDVQ